MNSVGPKNLSLKYNKNCKNIGIKKFKFVAKMDKNQFYCEILEVFTYHVNLVCRI